MNIIQTNSEKNLANLIWIALISINVVPKNPVILIKILFKLTPINLSSIQI